MVILGSILSILLVLSLWRRYHHSLAALKFKYKLYALRDRLRMLSVDGVVNCDDWVFDFMDRSLSKSISDSYHITLVRLILLNFAHSEDLELGRFNEKLERTFASNPEFEKIRTEYLLAVKEYVIDQHYVSVNIILKPGARVIFGASTAAFKLNSWLKGILVYPETSAYNSYALR